MLLSGSRSIVIGDKVKLSDYGMYTGRCQHAYGY